MIPRLLGRTVTRLSRAIARIDRNRTLALVGGSSLALALGVVFLPWLFPAAAFRPLSALVGSPPAVVAFAALAGLVGVRALRETATPSAGPDRPDPRTPTRPPERAYYEEHRTTGVQIDRALAASPEEKSDLDSARRTARSRIRETAVSAVAAAERVDRETAAERIAAGSWTDDPRAAAFLAGRHHAPLRTRIRDWASGERFERWASHAVAEIEARERAARAGGDRTDGGPNEREPEEVRA